MGRRSIEERLAQLEAQKKTLTARLTKQERANDTRRKVLIGALVLYQMSRDKSPAGAELKAWLQAELPGFLTRERDALLFDDILAAETIAKVAALPPVKG